MVIRLGRVWCVSLLLLILRISLILKIRLVIRVSVMVMMVLLLDIFFRLNRCSVDSMLVLVLVRLEVRVMMKRFLLLVMFCS